jgi:type I restriction enzyme S subunit
MSPSRVLDHFERISEAPDAVPRLRQFILDLAVRGKLVEQDPKDEPAAELLKRIQAEKGRRARPSTPVRASDLPFDLRSGWAPTTVDQVLLELQTGPFGSSLHQSDYLKGGTPVINPASIQNGCLVPIDSMAVGSATLERLATFKLRKGDVVMARRGEMGRCAVVTEQEHGWLCGTGSLVLRLPEGIFPRFLATLIGSPLVREYLGGSAVGTTMQNLNQSILLRMAIGLPPLAEQHRIVAKVDELMALCDRLEAAQTERETRRDRLVAASLNRINEPVADTDDAQPFRDHARFHLTHLPRLTTRPEHIHQLRQTILNLAVRGRLVAQDPNDEPVSEDASAANEEPPTSIPISWKWRRLESLSDQITDGEHATPPRIHDEQVPLVTAKNVRDGHMDYAVTDWVSFETAERAWKRCRPSVGDILLVCVGATTGRLCVLKDAKDMVLVRSVALIRPASSVDVEYLARALRSPMCQAQMWERVKVTAQPCLYINRMRALPIPLPPLAEQHRIVAKVDELMALCDRLEAQLTTTQTESRRLLEAVLHQALNPETP